MLVFLLLALTTQAYHPTSDAKVDCLDYAEGTQQADAERIKEAVECVTTDQAQFLGFYCNVRACAAAVRNVGGTVFKWGGDGSEGFTSDRPYRKSKTGWATLTECWIESVDSNGLCQVRDGQYDVWKIKDEPRSPKAKLIKRDRECKSGDKQMTGTAIGGVLECRNAVKKQNGKFFIFGKARTEKKYSCWMENTQSASCTEGWEVDSYDFWEVTEESAEGPNGYSCIGRCGGGTSCHKPTGECRDNPNTPATTCRGKCAGGNCCNMSKIRCEPCKTAFESELGVTYRDELESELGAVRAGFSRDELAFETSTESHRPLMVNAFAVIGLGAMLYGAARFYLNK